MRTRIGITLAVAVLLGDPTTVLAQPVLLGDSTGSNYTGPASTVQSSSSAGIAHHCCFANVYLRGYSRSLGSLRSLLQRRLRLERFQRLPRTLQTPQMVHLRLLLTTQILQFMLLLKLALAQS